MPFAITRVFKNHKGEEVVGYLDAVSDASPHAFVNELQIWTYNRGKFFYYRTFRPEQSALVLFSDRESAAAMAEDARGKVIFIERTK